jgi:acetate---CoA ligase (ADP-forming)
VTGAAALPDADAALRAAFSPAAITIVGASRTPGKMGHVTLRALVEAGFPGRLYPVNPGGGEFLGLHSYSRVADLPEVPDFALIALRRPAVAEAVRECAAMRIPVIQVLTSGYGEMGGPGLSAEQELRDIARGRGSRLVGPNCVGTFSASARVTWTPQADFAPGGISFISQSGGLAYDLLAGGRFHGLAFDKIASVGNCADLDIADYLRFFAHEQSTTVVGVYVEGPRDGRRMFGELAALAAVKPVLVLKGGRSDTASASVTSHTGRIAGSYRVWQAAIRQAGAIEVKSFAEMVTGLAGLQSGRPGPRRRVALVGNGGGVTVLAADSCADQGLEIATVNTGTSARLASLLDAVESYRPGAEAVVELPIDRLLSGDGRLLAILIRALREDPGVDTVILHINLVPLSDRNDVLASMHAVFQTLKPAVEPDGPPVLLALRAGADPGLASVRQELASATRSALGLLTFHELNDAIRCLAIAAKDTRSQDSLTTPGAASATGRLADASPTRRTAARPPARRAAADGRAGSWSGGRHRGRAELQAARARGDTALDEARAKQLLTRYGLDTPRGRVITGRDNLPDCPADLGPPYVLKALARVALHKSRLGAVQLGIASAAELSAAVQKMREQLSRSGLPVHGYLVEEQVPAGTEIIIGSKLDETFGRVVMTGFGGTLVEAMARVAIRLWPISAVDADEMIADLNAGGILASSENIRALVRALLHVAGPGGLLSAVDDLVTEIDLNPVIVQAGRATVADARIMLRPHPAGSAERGG